MGHGNPAAGSGICLPAEFSLGMCALLVAVGLFSGAVTRLPRAGVWMVWVKRCFALVMLGVAEYYLIQMGKLLF